MAVKVVGSKKIKEGGERGSRGQSGIEKRGGGRTKGGAPEENGQSLWVSTSKSIVYAALTWMQKNWGGGNVRKLGERITRNGG